MFLTKSTYLWLSGRKRRLLGLFSATFPPQPSRRPLAKVLITVKLDDRIPPDVAEWRNWLRRQIPTDVAEIDVEGIFEASSKVVLLRLPVAVWDMLPDHDAYSFVGYVRSSNLIVKQLEPRSRQCRLHLFLYPQKPAIQKERRSFLAAQNSLNSLPVSRLHQVKRGWDD
jgi:hypothetical protein